MEALVVGRVVSADAASVMRGLHYRGDTSSHRGTASSCKPHSMRVARRCSPRTCRLANDSASSRSSIRSTTPCTSRAPRGPHRPSKKAARRPGCPARDKAMSAEASDRCPRCGGGFHCGANDAAPCACTALQLDAAALAELRARYDRLPVPGLPARVRSVEPSSGACAMKLLTWNVQWCRGVDGRVDPERIVLRPPATSPISTSSACRKSRRNFADPALAGSRGEDQFTDIAGAGFAGVHGDQGDRGRHPRLPDRPGRRRFGNLLLSRLPDASRRSRHLLPRPVDADMPACGAWRWRPTRPPVRRHPRHHHAPRVLL